MALVNPNIALAGVPMQVPNFLGMQQTAAATQNTLARTGIMQEEAARESESAEYNTALARSKDALRFVNTPEQYMAWTDASFSDPVLGSQLSRLGLTPDSVKSSALKQFQQPGGFQNVMQMSAANIDQLAGIMGGRASAMAKQQQTAAANARQAAIDARIAQIMGDGAAPTATAQPVPPPVNTLATPARGVGANALNAPPMAAAEEIAQTYAPAMPGAAPSVVTPPPLTARSPNAVAATNVPAGAPNAAQPTVPATALPVDAIQAEIAALADKADQLYSLRDPAADAEAKRVEARIKLLRDQLPKGALVNINMPEEAKSFEDKVGREGVKNAYEGLTKSEDAVQIVRNAEVGRDILDEGAITGSGANFFVGFNQALKTAGMDFGYADASANSQAYAAAMAQNVGRVIPLFGAGTGLSDADREYAKQMAAGEIKLDEAALRKILRINEDAARIGIEAHNKRMEKMGAPDYLKVDPPPFNVDRVPPAAIEMLRNDTKLKKKFDQKYGYGYSDFILGNQNGQ